MNPHIVDLRMKAAQKERARNATPSDAGGGESTRAEGAREETAMLQWETLEFPERDRDADAWTRRILVIAIPLAVLFLLLKNFLGVVLVVLAAIALFAEALRKPRFLTYTIDAGGVGVNGTTRPYKELESFWIFEEARNVRELSIKTKKMFGQHLSIPLGNMDPDDVRSALEPHLPEIEQHRSAFDLWLRKNGF